MIYGGGLEAVGWQGILQPLLQKQFPFLISVLIEGVIWGICPYGLSRLPHRVCIVLPLSHCSVLLWGATLAAAHKITGSIWVSVLLHAWSNTVLGGMYSLASLCSFPNMKTLAISLIQIFAVIALAYLMKMKPVTSPHFNDHASE